MLRSLAAIALLTVAGCGLSDYEAEMAKSLAKLQEKTRYTLLSGPTQIDKVVGNPEDQELVELPITVRLPKAFGQNDWFRPGSIYRYRNEPVPEDVLYPPFLGEFPGLTRMAETYAEAEERTFLGYYCYLGVLESRSVKFETVLADLHKKTSAKLKNATKWQDVECKDEDLVATTWKMLEATGLQDFLNRSEQISAVPGTFRVYAREEQGYIILWAVRLPNALLDKVPLLDLSDAVAGTVRVTAPAPAEPETPPADAAPAGATPADESAAADPPPSDPSVESAAADKPTTEAPPADEAANPTDDVEVPPQETPEN